MKKTKKSSLSCKGGGNLTGRGRDVAKEILAERLGEDHAEEVIQALEEDAKQGEYLKALGYCGAVAERDIRNIRKRDPLMAELMSAVFADCMTFTFAKLAEEYHLDRRTVRHRLWTAAQCCPWLFAILTDRMERMTGK